MGGTEAGSSVDEDVEEERIKTAPDIEQTQKEQLVLARRGQGQFRRDVLKIFGLCPITQMDDPRFLIASHIKPWAVSTNIERLDGQNGLPLSPHIDHLFDKGWISFSQKGQMLVSGAVPKTLWAAWRLPEKAAARFPDRTLAYLEFHERFRFIDNRA